MGGNCGCGGGGGGTGAGGSSSTKTGSSRVGLPHLWQKRASSGSFAPQVQYSGTPSVWHVILDFAMSGPTLLVIADPSAPFLKSLSRLPEHLRLVVSDDPASLSQAAPDADAILYAASKAGVAPGRARAGPSSALDSFAVDRRRRHSHAGDAGASGATHQRPRRVPLASGGLGDGGDAALLLRPGPRDPAAAGGRVGAVPRQHAGGQNAGHCRLRLHRQRRGVAGRRDSE